jgi:hypothetical protein
VFVGGLLRLLLLLDLDHGAPVRHEAQPQSVDGQAHFPAPKKLIIQPKTYMILDIYLCTRAPVRQRHQAVARVDELAEQIDRAFQLASLHRLETHVKHFLQPFRLHLYIHQQ